ncbi:hypothetical protein BASA60_003029 [Batrachochytrium salamandrivorans]|nr:hypothetical protein BASA60_003029 [Batrachochytrium salamandrivorans]KAH9270297.1 hypothetical protein BASA83_007636 [Batrachochytrium salamandrivorans]
MASLLPIESMPLFEPAVPFHLNQVFVHDELSALQHGLADHFRLHRIEPPSLEQLTSLVRRIQSLQHSLHNSSQLTTLRMVRIPTRMFKDTSPTGALSEIIKTAAIQCPESAWSEERFQGLSRLEEDKRDLIQIAENLQKTKLWQLPTIYFSNSVPEYVKESFLPGIRMMKGHVALEYGDNVTHVIQGDDSNTDDQQDVYFRTLEISNGNCLLHYWFSPDSADVWVPKSSGDFSDPEEQQQHSGFWTVTVRWIKDSIKNQEWMNEDDYEIDPPDEVSSISSIPVLPQTAQDDLHIGSQLDGSGENSAALRNDFFNDVADDTGETPTELQDFQEVASDDVEYNVALDTGTYVAGSPSTHAIDGGQISGHSAYDELITWRATTTDIDRRLPMKVKRHEYEPIPEGTLLNISLSSLVCPPDYIRSALKSSCSNSKSPSWFSIDAVHDIEMDIFRDNPLYVSVRNQIVGISQSSPGKYICVADCAAQIQADLVFIVLIHEFLEYHGIINHEMPITTKFIASSLFDIDVIRSSKTALVPETPLLCANSLVYDPYLEHQTQLTHNDTFQKAFICNICDAGCIRMRYECVKFSGLTICGECFVSGRYPSIFSSKDFVRKHGPIVKQAVSTQTPWSDDQVVKLLDSIDRYGFEWDAISDDMETKTPMECIEFFLQMPIAEMGRVPIDSLADTKTIENKDSSANDRTLEGHGQYLVPQIVGGAPNPLMSLIHMISCAVHPSLASEAARIGARTLLAEHRSDWPPENHDHSQLVLSAAEEALNGAIRYAKNIAAKEESILSILVHDLTDLQLQRIQSKLAFLLSTRASE